MDFDVLDDGPMILNASLEELNVYMQQAFSLKLETFGRTLYCYSPTGYPYNIPDHSQKNPSTFPSASITGTSCSLMCEHCKGHLLTGMASTQTPEELIEFFREVQRRGGEGALVSGGSDSKGHVPLYRFKEALQFGTGIGLKIVVHTGIIDPKTAEMLENSGIDAVMLDILADEAIAERVYHLSDGPSKIHRSLELLEQHSLSFVPHILIGLNYGKIGGELEALHLISNYKPKAIVIIVLSPMRRTPMHDVSPPSPELIGRLLTIARLSQPAIPLLLGCARPIGEHKIATDIFAIRAGVNGIAYISQNGVDYARKQSLVPVFEDVCCSLIFQEFMP